MKKLKYFIGMILALIMALSFAACSDTQNNNADSKDMVSAAQKLTQTDGFRLVMTMDNKKYDPLNATEVAVRSLNTYSYQMLRNKDTQTIYGQRTLEYTKDGQTDKSEMERVYYSGKEGYVYDCSDADTDKWISDTDFDLSGVLQQTASLKLGGSNTAALEKIKVLSPQKAEGENGETVYTLQNMTAKNFAVVYAALIENLSVEEIEQYLSADCMLNVTVKVNKDGYLSEFKLEMLNVAASSRFQDMAITFTIDQINEISAIEEPDFVKSFEVEFLTTVFLQTNGQVARYWFDEEPYGGTPGFVLSGLGRTYNDEYVVSCYEVPTQIEGKPVVVVGNVNYAGSVNVERMIIPAGVRVKLFRSALTTFFFEDAEANVDKNFITFDQLDDSSSPFVEAAYYEGQWEMVNGIPTPKN